MGECMKHQKVSNLFNVAIYIRLSREDGDKEESDSVGNQRKLLTEYVAKKEDFILYDIYVEIIVPYMIRLRFRDFVKECKNLLIYRLSHTEGCAKVLFFCPLFSTDYFERVQLSVHDGNFAHPYNDEAVP